MKKLFILMFCLVLLVGTISAFEFDNIKQYDEETKTITVKNSILGIPFLELDTISTMKLDTPQINKVGAGDEVKISQITTDDVDGYENFYQGMTLIDLKTGKEIEREITFRYLTYENVQIPDTYKESCETLKNSTKVCNQVPNTYRTKQKEVWNDFDINKGIPKGKTIMGIFTEVKVGDYVEWVPKLYGIEIEEWAVWDSTLDAGLTDYWAMDIINATGTGTYNNVTEAYDRFLYGGPMSVTGIIETAINFSSTSGNYSSTTTARDLNSTWTYNFWMNVVANTDYNAFLNIDPAPAGDSSNGEAWRILQNGTIASEYQATNTYGNVTVSNSTDTMITIVGDETKTWVYANGVLAKVDSKNLANDWSALYLSTPRANPHPQGWFDEIGLWNRSLTPAEVTQLYNGGAGLRYGSNVPPYIVLEAPEDAITITVPTINLSCRAFDSGGITNVSLLWNGTVDQTNSSGYNNSVYNFTKAIDTGTGLYNWSCQAYDDENGLNNSAEVRTLTYENNLKVELTSPIETFNSTSTTINFVGNASDDTALINVSLYLDSILNETNSSGFNATNYTFTKNLADGNHDWYYEACDDYSCVVTEIRNLSIDTILPTINITAPIGTIDSAVIGGTEDFNWTATDENIDTCWYDYDTTNTTVTCNLNTTTFTLTSQRNLTFWVNDTFGNLASDFTSWGYNFLEEGATWNTTTFETSSETFELNMSTVVNILSISAILHYNGTQDVSTASCDSGSCVLSNTIDIPLVNDAVEYENKSFLWEIDIFNGTNAINFNTSSRQQNVSKIHLEECDGTFTDVALNFSVWDEQTLLRINPYSFNGTFNSWLGSGSIFRNNSFTNSSDEFVLCISPDEVFKIDAIIDYDEQAGFTNYTSRFYYFDNEPIKTDNTNISMYLLNGTSSTSFILKVQDDSLLPVDDALIEIHRYYPGEGIFRVVQISQTDDNGKSIGFFETEIVDYKFIIKKDGVTLLETGQQKIIPETSPFTLTFNTGEPLEEPWSSQEDLSDLISSLNWSSTSGVTNYTYIDSSGSFALARLLVVKTSLVNSTEDTTICNVNLSIASGTLSCTVGSTDGFYTASAFITRGSTITLDKQILFQIETLSGVVGLLGLFFGWFLVLIAAFMFKFNEIAGIWAVTMTIFLINLTGLINFGGVFVTATIAIAIILTWIMER